MSPAGLYQRGQAQALPLQLVQALAAVQVVMLRKGGWGMWCVCVCGQGREGLDGWQGVLFCWGRAGAGEEGVPMGTTSLANSTAGHRAQSQRKAMS